MKKQILIFIITILTNSFLYINAYSQEKKDSTSYKKIKIGNQIWMTENLNVSRFRNNEVIFQAKTKQEWLKAAEEKKAAWCYYEFNTANEITYGKLYNWYAVQDIRGLAPIGWHIPSGIEWTTLSDELGGDEFNAGPKLKSINGWNDEGGGDNSSGFNGLPGGICDTNGIFSGLGSLCEWWSNAESESNATSIEDEVWTRLLDKHFSNFLKKQDKKNMGASVRCIKD